MSSAIVFLDLIFLADLSLERDLADNILLDDCCDL